MKNWIALILILVCLGFSVEGYCAGINVGEISVSYEATLDSQFIIGAMPKVVLNTDPGVEICGIWYKGGQYASVPNGTREQGEYCRTTDETGMTFFAYRDRFNTRYEIGNWTEGLVDLSIRNVSFEVLSPENFIVPVY